MIKITKAINVEKSIRNKMSELFVDSFYDYFHSFNVDRAKLIKSLKNSFCLDKYYLVLLDNELIGFGACGNGSSCIKFNKFSFYLQFGISKGSRLFKYLKLIFENRDYAFEMDEKCGMIEFLNVRNDYRNKRVGFTLSNHIMCDNAYERYLAKVADNNVSAKKMLLNIGFEEFDVDSATGKEKEDIGVNNYLYMICENPNLKK